MFTSEKPKIEENKTKDNMYGESVKLLRIENELCGKLQRLTFQSPIDYIYNPLNYAKSLHETFVKKYFEDSTKKILFLGINPGPWGMCQTGIPFGEVNHVKDWFKIVGSVEKPKEHPKRKITGLNCHRSEISGKKFWNFFKELCKTPENFFKNSFIYNLCPLAFVESSGKNITPPEIKNTNLKNLLYKYCEEALVKIIREFNFEIIIAIGRFAEKSALKTLKSEGLTSIKVYFIPHPSPRNAKNSKDWESDTLNKFQEYNLLKYFNT